MKSLKITPRDLMSICNEFLLASLQNTPKEAVDRAKNPLFQVEEVANVPPDVPSSLTHSALQPETGYKSDLYQSGGLRVLLGSIVKDVRDSSVACTSQTTLVVGGKSSDSATPR